MSRWQRITRALGLLPLILGACATPNPTPEDQYYRLVALRDPTRLTAPMIEGTLKVEPINSFGIYRERAILYTQKGHPESLKQYHYHYWIDTPTRLIREQLIDYLRKSGVAKIVTGSRIDLNGAVHLYLDLKQFERVIHPSGKISVRVRLDVVITDTANQPRRIASYPVERLADDSSIGATVAAMNLALGGIYRQLIDDLLAL